MKYIQITIFLLVCLSFGCKYNSKPDLEIAFSANWEKEDIFKYKVISKKEDIEYEMSQGVFESIQVVQLKVIDKSDDFYKLEWKVIDVLSPDGIEMDLTSKEVYEKMLANYKIEYYTDRQGRFKELINWEEVLEFQFEIMKNISEIIEEQQDLEYEKIELLMREMYGTREQIENMFIPEIKLIHSLHGDTYHTKKANFRNKQISNVLGDSQVEVMTILTIEEIDTVEKTLSGVEHFELDEITKNNMHNNFTKDMEIRFEKQDKTSASDLHSKFQIEDKISFKLDYNLGIINDLRFKRNAVMESQTKSLERNKEFIIKRIL